MASININSRRGGGSPDATLPLWKYLILASLLLLVTFLMRLNYQLVREISRSGSGDAVTNVAASEGVRTMLDEDSEAQNEISSLKEDVVIMKGIVKEIQGQQDAGALPSHR